MKLATITNLATSALLAASLVIVAIGCGERTGSPINGGDPVPERLDAEPPYARETNPLDVPDETPDSDAEPGAAPPENDAPPIDFRPSPAGSALENTDDQ